MHEHLVFRSGMDCISSTSLEYALRTVGMASYSISEQLLGPEREGIKDLAYVRPKWTACSHIVVGRRRRQCYAPDIAERTC